MVHNGSFFENFIILALRISKVFILFLSLTSSFQVCTLFCHSVELVSHGYTYCVIFAIGGSVAMVLGTSTSIMMPCKVVVVKSYVEPTRWDWNYNYCLKS